MIYVMSDLHGQYELYEKMLEKIQFSQDDLLYVLGDVLDRGDESLKILLDMMERPNVVFLAGNHEVMAMQCLPVLMQEMTKESIAALDEDAILKLMRWLRNGAQKTIDAFHKLDSETRQAAIEYIEEAELYEEIEMGEKTYLLVHGGLRNFKPDKELWEYELDALVWERPDYEIPYFTDYRYVITGHTPTLAIRNNLNPGYIYRKNHHIAIDCGCCYDSGRLGCIRLDDEKEFYVERPHTQSNS